MSRKKRNWLAAIGVSLVLVAAGLVTAGYFLAKRFQPYVREQAIQYLEQRFNSDVEIKELRLRLPNTSVFRMVLTRGRGAIARVEGEGISMRHKSHTGLPPLFAMKKFSFDVDLGTLFEAPRVVPLVSLDGLEIHVPPKGERPRLNVGNNASERRTDESKPNSSPVIIKQVQVRNARLVILPRDRTKTPLEFDIHRLHLDKRDTGEGMAYDASLTNAKPPGEIQSKGTFGPWAAEEPADTPLAGEYTFEKADLGVFNAIAGILRSTGRFDGKLSSIHAQGEATVPDFRLKMAGNPVPLATQFEVEVDGTNGNTILKPVHATLGKTKFTTSGGVIKHEAHQRRTIKLDVSMPQGDLEDLLRLAMKGSPFMEGQVFLKTSIDIPPLSGKVKEKIGLNGEFQVTNGKFIKSTIQEQIDSLSRRGQGQPKNEKIDQVVSAMGGVFRLENEVVTFYPLSFEVPGAAIDLTGNYDLDTDALDFRGTLKLQAKVSQTMTGWKRWALKPVDPILAKQGAGTFLRIKVDGTSRDPKFGLDRGRKDTEKKEGAKIADSFPAAAQK